MAASQMFVAEQKTGMAQAAKLERDRALAPWRIGLAGMAAGAAFFGGRRGLREASRALTEQSRFTPPKPDAAHSRRFSSRPSTVSGESRVPSANR